MNKYLALMLTTTLYFCPALLANESTQKKIVTLNPDNSLSQFSDQIQGNQFIDYRINIKTSQTLNISLASSNISTFFNILTEKSSATIFTGSTLGRQFTGTIPADGIYLIRVYLIPHAVKRKETSQFTLAISLTNTPVSFNKTLSLQGIHFRVMSARNNKGPVLRISPSGLSENNDVIETALTGIISDAEVADLNSDGSPEIYVYIQSPNHPSQLVAYSSNKRKSLSEIYLPPITDNKKAVTGFNGNDEFRVVESRLIRRFPLQAPSKNKTRQIQYKLVPGEASWLLKVDKIVDY